MESLIKKFKSLLIGFAISFYCFPIICNGQTEIDSTVFLKNVGKEILEGKEISRINEKYLYQLIDSIQSKDSTERAFYFKIFREIRKQAKEYLAEEVDFQAKHFCLRYPNDFFSLPGSELKSYAYDIGELLRTEEEFPEQAAKDYIAEIKKKCDSNHLKKVEKFSKDIFDEMESRK